MLGSPVCVGSPQLAAPMLASMAAAGDADN